MLTEKSACVTEVIMSVALVWNRNADDISSTSAQTNKNHIKIYHTSRQGSELAFLWIVWRGVGGETEDFDLSKFRRPFKIYYQKKTIARC